MILISPYSRPLRNNNRNSKNYPWWAEVIRLLQAEGYEIGQVGEKDEVWFEADEFFIGKPFEELKKLVAECEIWVAVDNFFPHLCAYMNKSGIVLFGKSDPNIFGHEENSNLIKSRSNLRPNQFDIWEGEPYDESVFVKPADVADAVRRVLLSTKVVA